MYTPSIGFNTGATGSFARGKEEKVASASMNQDLPGIGMTLALGLSTLVALCSIVLGKPTQSSLVVLGDISIGGTLIKVENFADTLQVCLDSVAKKVLILAISNVDITIKPPELFTSFNNMFYNSAEDSVLKALWVE